MTQVKSGKGGMVGKESDRHLIERSEEQSMLLDVLMSWASSTIGDSAQAWDEEQELPVNILREAEELGLFTISLSEALGGAEMGFDTALLAIETLAQFDPSLALKVALLNGPIASLWPKDLTPEDAATWATGTLQINRTGATGFLGDVPWAESAKWLLLPQGDRLYLINLMSDKVKRTPQRERLGLRCAEWADLQFDGAPVLAYPLSRRDFLTAEAWLNLGWSAIGLGAGSAGIREGVKYAMERVQFGKPVSEQQALQWMIADSVTELDAARMLTYEAARALQSTEAWSLREGVRLAAEARLLAAEASHHACDRGLQMHGGYGFTREYQVERFWRDVQRVFPIRGRSGLDHLVMNGLNED